ncbi:MarR family winged helix-turn-helix transcriptional regulator [Conexibacter stalactiti]|uniref:MarR family winged helix-turn-helix transcriptional regulator n=1 Tax=Conexibacter stalactiti TaxID=1940611 RepID=A0ABU4HKY2_9ACTN|nr:MarR family winged helix-turn-helix transcriptional regulator [Conexibacter stalactiti]MDW5593369.1 MarR family winged helix-turn-helix transcriptional regulator [Conexibacter stalactiti]MEC5034010.1 MarR family winged helix-turn-helix transcriptional regulator [Conexibacter stalactiti]
MGAPHEDSAARIRWLFAQKELACARYVRAVASSLELSENELRALVCIARHGEISPSLLSLRTGLSVQVVGAISSRLGELGLIERRRHERDRRSRLLRLTADAEATLQASFAALTERIDSVFEALPQRDRRVVAAFLERVADASAEAAGDASLLPGPGSLAAAG